ncbi:DegT/DnrJ/EryC1/StrS family aminotransferase [Aerococcus urinaeequi]|uniref:DegT/DnrJ/EryC1/StrS family aminotransferase n=1 Tax=Aerococcus urinaeequi TaxID=51665 RepID=UPI003D6A58AD
MGMEKIYLASPHMSDEGFEREFVKEAFDTNWIAPLGHNVNEFENELSKMVGIDYALALDSGTSAIHLALKAAGVGEGDIVFCQSLTFSATANPIRYEKAIPVFIDSERVTWNMDPELLEQAFEKYAPKAVIVVHLYGVSSKIDQIKEICDKHGVALIEDAAESLGTIFKGQWTGTFGDYGIYSFNGNKIITTSGGGMLVSNHKDGIDKARYWATQARDAVLHYEHKDIGYNYRLSNISAGIGRGQLKILSDRIEKKRAIYHRYRDAFKDIDEIEMLPEHDYERANYWLSAFQIHSEKITPQTIIDVLNEANIESRPVWKPMHMQPVFEDCDFIGGDVAQSLYENGVCLPSDSKMTEEQQDRVIEGIRKTFLNNF